jgi:hypothetical protein
VSVAERAISSLIQAGIRASVPWAAPRPDGPRRRSACGARPAPSVQPEDGTDRGSKPQTPDTRHCHAASTGTGKTHLCIAVASAVILTRARGRYFNLVDLVNQMEQEKAAGRSGRLSEKLLRYDVIVIDELGIGRESGVAVPSDLTRNRL